MTKHFIVWHPKDGAAFRGTDEDGAKLAACNRFGTVTDWDTMAKNGWRITEVFDMDRSRHYGLLVGDLVEERFGGVATKGVVIALHLLDNNGATIRMDDGTETKVVCEWCRIIEKVDGP